MQKLIARWFLTAHRYYISVDKQEVIFTDQLEFYVCRSARFFPKLLNNLVSQICQNISCKMENLARFSWMWVYFQKIVNSILSQNNGNLYLWY